MPNKPTVVHVTQLDSKQFEAIDLKLSAIRGAINRHADSTGKWLAIIAQAIGGTDPEIQKQIDEAVKELAAGRADLQSAVDSQTKTKE